MTGMTRDEKLDQLIAKQEIREVLARYSRGIDRHDVEMVTSVYHPDARDRHGSTFSGTPEELVRWGNEEHARNWTAHLHQLTTSTIEVVGERAASETYVMWVQRRRDAPRVDVGGGRYLDRLERRDGEWRIRERELVVDWVFEADSEDRRDVMGRYPNGQWDPSDPSYEMFEELRRGANAGPPTIVR